MKTIRSKTGARQLQKKLNEENPPAIEVAFLLQDWTDAYNVGGLFRIADACGATEIMLAGRTPSPPDPMISVTSLGNHRRVNWRQMDRYEDAARQMKADGYSLIAIEIAEDAHNYVDFDYPSRTCLVLGNEQSGVYDKVLRLCDSAVVIPMAGKGRSLNVHVAAAIVAFQAIHGLGSGTK